MMERFLYHIHIYFSRWSAFFAEHFSTQKHLHTARLAFLHELAKISHPKDAIAHKMAILLIGIGQFNQVFCVKPTETQKELGNWQYVYHRENQSREGVEYRGKSPALAVPRSNQ